MYCSQCIIGKECLLSLDLPEKIKVCVCARTHVRACVCVNAVVTPQITMSKTVESITMSTNRVDLYDKDVIHSSV